MLKEYAQDKNTGAIIMISNGHHEAHDGHSFIVSAYDKDLDNGQEISIALKTPVSPTQIHMFIDASNSSESIFQVLESPTITAGSGTTQSALNKNRILKTASTVKNIADAVGEVTVSPTITADGTASAGILIGAGREKGISNTREELEIILDYDTLYAFRITGENDNGSANISLSWYEHTSKKAGDR